MFLKYSSTSRACGFLDNSANRFQISVSGNEICEFDVDAPVEALGIKNVSKKNQNYPQGCPQAAHMKTTNRHTDLSTPVILFLYKTKKANIVSKI